MTPTTYKVQCIFNNNKKEIGKEKKNTVEVKGLWNLPQWIKKATEAKHVAGKSLHAWKTEAFHDAVR